MRYACLAVVSVLGALAPSLAQGQPLSITNFQLVSAQPATQTTSNFTYRADIVNSGVALSQVTASVSSSDPFSIRVVPGQDTLQFAPVPSNSQVTSGNTFTIQSNPTIPIDFTKLQFGFQTVAQGPVANAGPNQIVRPGSTVTLDGSGSTNASGVGTLTYSWVVTSRPAGSSSILQNQRGVMPTFVADAMGTWLISLTVSNGPASSTVVVSVSTSTSPAPVANAGPNQTVGLGSTVVLNGGGSTSGSGNPLAYAWILKSRPASSAAALTGASTVSPTFAADKPGSYTAQLIVNDGGANSAPSTVTIATQIVKPVANAGQGQVVSVGSVAQLNGAGSTDANGLPLTYQWSLIALPAGSAAALSNPAAVNPAFTPDLAGTYVAQLIVNNGTLSSDPATVAITTNPILAPTANAGTNQTVNGGATVTLGGSGTDPQNLPLTYQWTLINKPSGSAAGLSGAVLPNPTFIADLAGTYVAQLVVNNGFLSSPPSTVTISTTCSQPTANPGPNQSVAAGATVALNGSGSGDACHDPLTYSWSLTARPAGSAAALSGATTVSPTFVADVAGTYVAQLIVNNGFTPSNPATVTITASSTPVISLAPNPMNLGNNSPGTLTVTLSSPAGPNGLVVSLAIGDAGVASVQSTVTVPIGASSASVTVTPSAIGNTTITASAPGFAPATDPLNVVRLKIAVLLDSGMINLGGTIHGTVSLSAPSSSSASISLQSNPNGIVDLQPPSITIPAGSMNGSFTITGLAQGSTTVTAVLPGYTTGFTNVTVSTLGALTVPANSKVGPGQSAAFPVTLSAPAPAGGVTVTLASSDPSKVTVTPASVTIAAGATAPAAQPQVTGVNFGSSTITASAPGYAPATGQVQVNATAQFAPGSLTINGFVSQNLTLNLSVAAPTGGLTINLSSDSPGVATVPATVTFAANATQVAVPVTGAAGGSAVIHASALPGVPDTAATVTVVPPPAILVNNVAVALGQSAAFAVTLPAAAPAGGVTVTLTSSDSAKATVNPASVFIAAGTTTPAAQPQVTGINVGSANITASTPAFGSATAQALVTDTISFPPGTVTILGGATQNLTLNLAAPAPTALNVNLSSSNTGVATVPPSVTFAANSTSAIVPVTGVGGGSAVIHASAPPNIADATASVTVTPGSITLPASPVALGLGQSAAFPVSLATPAPAGGVTIALTSSDPSKVTVTASVAIAAGATTPAAQPQVKGVNFGSASITASATGYTSGSQTAQVTGMIAFTPAVLTIGSGIQNLTLTLSGPAPAGGVTVNLSSSNSAAATVPATATFGAGATTVNVPVTGLSAGSTAIHASALPNLADTTASVTVSGDIILPVNLTVPPGQQANFPITLANPAPSGGVFLSLSSSDPSKVSLNVSSVFIPQGGTVSNQPKVTGVGVGSAAIGVSASGLLPASQTVQVNNGFAISFQPSSLTIGGPQNLTLILSAAAPAGGLNINLSSSDPTKATVPATVTFAAGSTAVNVPVTPVASGSTVIHASALPNIADTTANVTVQSLSLGVPSAVSVNLGQSAAFAVTLSQAAPAGGVTVSLSSSDTAKVTVPASVFIAAGATAPAAQPQVTGTGIGSATITASGTGLASASGTVTVPAPSISFAGSPLAVAPGGTGNLTLNLSGGQAPAGGLTVSLSSSDATKATVPSTVSFAAGATSATVSVSGVAAGSAMITASATGIQSATATVNVSAVVIPQIGIPATTVLLGQSTALSIILSAPAPSDLTVNLVSGDGGKVTVSPATITILQGAMTPATPPQVTGAGIGATTVTASAAGYTSGVGTVNVPAPVMQFAGNLTLNSGAQGNLTLNLTNGKAPAGGLTVNLNSDNTSIATVPATVSFAAGATSAAVQVTGVAVGSATVTATAANIASATASVTVNPLGGINVSSPSVGLNQSAALTVTLPVAAPAGGVTVTLSSSDATKVTVSPASVTIAAGATAPATQPQVTGTGAGTATITANATGYTSGSGTVTVSALAMNFSPAALTVGSGAQGTLTLNLSGGQAPAAGLTVNLSSDNAGAATVPATLTFAGGATSASVTVTALTVQANQTANVTASASGIASATAKVTVTPLPTITVAPLSVGLGQSANLQVSLPVPAAAAVTITLASDSANATVSPSSVTIAAGATTPATAPQVTGLAAGSPAANITASATGYAPGTGAVNVTASINFTGPLALTPGATGNLTLNLAGGQAPPAGLTVNLTSSATGVATVPATASFAAGATSTTVTVSGVGGGSATITASAPGIAPATVQVAVSGSISVANLSVGLGLSANLQVTLAQAAPAGGVTVTLASGDSTKVTVPASVFIAAGATTPAAAPQATGAGIGSAAITASATGFSSGTGTVTVIAPAMSFTGSPLAVNAGATGTLTLNLSGGQAPAGGLSVNLSSSATGVATVPASVAFAAGATSAAITVSGVAGGSATITASAPGILPTTATVNVTQQSINAANTTVGLGQSAAFAVTLSLPAPAGGVTVSLSSGDPTTVTVSPATVSIPAGTIAPTTQPRVTGAGVGSAIVTASAPGYSSASPTVTVSAPTLSFSGDVTLNAGTSATVSLNLVGGQAPAGGLTVNVITNAPAVATVGSANFAPGATSAIVTVTGVGQGSALITAFSNSPHLAAVNANVTVLAPISPLIQPISVPTVSVGQNLENSITLSLVTWMNCTPGKYPQGQTCGASGLIVSTLDGTTPIQFPAPAPAGGLVVTVTSSNPSKVLPQVRAVCPGVANPTNTTVCGAQQIVTTIPPNLSTATIVLQGFASSGTAIITASAPGFPSGSATITLTPSGFLLAGPTGSSFTTNAAATPTTLTVSSARLDSSLNFAENQQVRSGFVNPLTGPFDDAQGTTSCGTQPDPATCMQSGRLAFANLSGLFTTTASVASSNPSVGSVLAPAVFAGGDNSQTAQFIPSSSNTGATTLTTSPPSGFSPPASGASVTANVNPATATCAPVTVGQNLQAFANCSLQGGVRTAGLPVTVTTADPRILLSATFTQGGTLTCSDAGSSLISTSTVAPLGNVIIPAFCVYGAASSGVASYTVTVQGFATATGTVTLAPSGFVIAGSGGIGATSFTALSATTTITVSSALLDSLSNFVSVQPLAVGHSASVTVASSNTSVGTISPATLSFTGGMSSNATTFTSGSPGSTVLSVSTPPGFGAPAQDTTVTANVASKGISSTCDGVMIGNNLQASCSVSIGQAAPAGGVAITLTSNDQTILLLSATGTTVGLKSITVTIPTGGFSATYFAQALAGSGAPTITAASAGFTSHTGTVKLAPSGVVLAGPFGLGTTFFFANVSGGKVPIAVYTAVLNPDPASCPINTGAPCYSATQSLRGGAAPLQVSLSSSSPGVGTIASPVTIAAGSGTGVAQFLPLTQGSTTVFLTTPAGFTSSTNDTSVSTTVGP